MKAVAVFVGLLALFGASSAAPSEVETINYQQRIFEDLINNTINGVIAIASKFDPIVIDHQEHTILGHSGLVENVNVQGFSNVVATRIKLSGLITWTLDLVLEAPRISASVDHWKVDGPVVYGDGHAKIDITNFKLTLKAKINPLGIVFKDLKVIPSIGNADVSITGIQNDEELSQKVTDTISYFLNDVFNNSTSFHDRLAKIILEIIKSIMGK